MQVTAVPRMTSRAGAVPAPSRPHDVNRVVGSFVVRYLDREDGVTFTAHQEFVTGGRVGARDGYDSLRLAMDELTIRTAGEDVPAAVVIERDGRYYGRTLKARRLEQGSDAPLERLHLEADKLVEVRELRVRHGLHERARAIVDGTWNRRFRHGRT